MQIKELRIRNLFNELSFSIQLKTSEVATIIYAPNGYGKTTVLEIVDSIFNFRLYALSRYVFDSIDICFVDGSRLEVRRKVSARKDRPPRLSEQERRMLRRRPSEERASVSMQVALTAIHYDQHDRAVDSQELSPDPDALLDSGHGSGQVIRLIIETTPHLRPHPMGAVDMRTHEVLGVPEILARYNHILEDFNLGLQPWLRGLLKKHHTTLIKTKRLDAEIVSEEEEHEFRGAPRKRQRLSVEKDSTEMTEHIHRALAEYSNLSQTLDRGFPRRLMTALAKPDSGTPLLPDALTDLDKKYSRIVNAGILRREHFEALPSHELANPVAQKVIALYIEDQRAKLQVFDRLLDQIETLRDLINRRFQRKRLDISRDQGYQIISNQERRIPIQALSSGEQHQLVLFHSLLFGMREGSLVMIDEPEISLHVAWQEEFLRDLQKIVRNTGVHFLIATHSPQIISDRWDLTVDLAAGTHLKP